MKKLFFSAVFIILLTNVFSSALWAKDLVSYPASSGYVNDTAGVVSAQDQAAITSFAAELEAKTTAQIAVVTVTSTQPLTIEQYAVELFKKWGIGQKGKDNGILFLIASQDHGVRIEVGYGLEGVVTDAMSSSIIHQIVIPQFKSGNMSDGVLQGTKAIISLIAKENGVTITGQEEVVYKTLHQDSNGGWIIVFVFIMLFAFYASIMSRTGPRRWGGYYGGFGGGGFSGGSGGGFGGFGGGGSGGGGSSGSW